MKVVFVAPYALPMSVGGFQSQVYRIFDELKDLGIDVSWHNFENSTLDNVDILQVMSTDSSMISMMKRAKNKGVKIVLTPMMGSRAASNSYLKVALRLSKLPQLFSSHKSVLETLHCADHLTPLCSFEANRMIDVYGFQKDQITIIPNGIDDSYFNDDVTNIEPPFKNYLLSIGRIEKEKNQLSLIEVAMTLNMNLIIVGEPGNSGDSYLRQCKSNANDNIFFWGLEHDTKALKQLYRQAALTVIPSLSEMAPLVAFESLSQKTPVVCTNRCGIANDVIPGLFFSDIDKQALINSIVKALKYNRSSITNKGIYRWADIATMYKNVYDNILNLS